MTTINAKLSDRGIITQGLPDMGQLFWVAKQSAGFDPSFCRRHPCCYRLYRIQQWKRVRTSCRVMKNEDHEWPLISAVPQFLQLTLSLRKSSSRWQTAGVSQNSHCCSHGGICSMYTSWIPCASTAHLHWEWSLFSETQSSKALSFIPGDSSRGAFLTCALQVQAYLPSSPK